MNFVFSPPRFSNSFCSESRNPWDSSKRIVSKLGSGWDLKTPTPAGDTIDYKRKEKQLEEGIVKNLKFPAIVGVLAVAVVVSF